MDDYFDDDVDGELWEAMKGVRYKGLRATLEETFKWIPKRTDNSMVRVTQNFLTNRPLKICLVWSGQGDDQRRAAAVGHWWSSRYITNEQLTKSRTINVKCAKLNGGGAEVDTMMVSESFACQTISTQSYRLYRIYSFSVKVAFECHGRNQEVSNGSLSRKFSPTWWAREKFATINRKCFTRNKRTMVVVVAQKRMDK